MDPVEEIKTKINIVDYIGKTVQLKKVGRNFKGLCPFHSEKTPSFIVSPDRQIWRCFGCNKGGDIFTFVMEMERMEFAEALRLLAEVAHVQLHTEPYETKDSNIRKRFLMLNHLASEYYHFILTKHRAGTAALHYLKNRGITDKSIKTFMLGFAPNGWENVLTFLRKKGFTDQEMESAGMVIKGTRGYYDRFRNRVMFTLRNHRNEVIGFAGRVLDPTAKDHSSHEASEWHGAKYVNTPETPLYIKGNTLYALEITKDAIRKENKAIVVEGELDAISSFQAGVGNIVAIKGTALTEAQINLLKRFTTNIYLALDRDSAGDSATRRSIELAEDMSMQTYVIVVPQGKDPDEAARENPVAWKQAVQTAVPYYDFLIDSAVHRYDVTSAYGKKTIVDELLPFVARIGNPIIQSHYLKTISERLGIKEEIITQSLRRVALPTSKHQEIVLSPREDRTELFILAALVQSSEPALLLSKLHEYEEATQLFTNPTVRSIIEHLNSYCKTNASFTPSSFARTLPQELVHTFDTALLYELPLSDDAEEQNRTFTKALEELHKRLLRRKIAVISTKLKDLSVADPLFVTLNEELTICARELKRIG